MTFQTRLAALEKKVQELENKSCTESLEKAEVLGSQKTVLAPDAQQLQGMACASEVLEKIMQLLENQKASFVEMLEKNVRQFECKTLDMELSVKSALKQNVQDGDALEKEVQLLKSQKSALKSKVHQLESIICDIRPVEKKVHPLENQKASCSETLEYKPCYVELLVKQLQEVENGRTLQKNMQELQNGKTALERKVHELENKLHHAETLEKKVQLLQIQKSALETKVQLVESTICHTKALEKMMHPLEDQKASCSEALENKELLLRMQEIESGRLTLEKNMQELQNGKTALELSVRELVNKPIEKVVRPLEGQALTAEQPKDAIQQLPIQTPILPKSSTTTKNNTKALSQTTNSPTAIVSTNNENNAETVNCVANCNSEGNLNKPTPAAATTSPAEFGMNLKPTYLNLIPPDMRKKALSELLLRGSNKAVYDWCRDNGVPAIPVHGRFPVPMWYATCCMIPDKFNVVTWRDIPHRS